MHHQDDLPPITHTEADETSQTRFGPRPVPEGHRRPPGPVESRRIPPHGDVSPDGSRPWPRPSRGAKWLVLGGTGLAAAALTAGTVLAARHVLDLVSQDGPPSRRRGTQAEPAATGRRAMPVGAGQQDEETRRPVRIRPQAERDRTPRPARRPPRQNLLQEVEANTASLTSGVENVMRALTAAVTGFRTVAGQASTIMQEFGDAAAMVRDIIDRRPGAPPSRTRSQARPDDRHGAHMPDLRDDPLLHDPMEGPDPGGPADHDPRVHRL
ncbi:hypothetical protein [Paracoccus sp. MKU1]|uniref:hypothetical protein n=1 Tax=Paracoccus sp. MKU1 TaxID=1745182 RepID=UPI0007191483|nr:hypothetical protein [Paracoccus sp. MKU1]KRW93618.1 hypothetical protein AQY21_24170 [Paracoccus sp. MKU1]